MIGPELRKRRKAAGLSQEQLADRWGVQRETISRWENSNRELPGYVEDAMNEVERGQQREQS